MKTKQYNVSMVIDVPDVGATEDEVEEWVKFQVGYCGGMSATNPLESHDIETNWIEVEEH